MSSWDNEHWNRQCWPLLLCRNNFRSKGHCTESEIFACIFQYSPSFPIKMHATDAKTQKIKPDPIFFDGRKFWRECANVIDTTWGRIYFFTCGNLDSVCNDLNTSLTPPQFTLLKIKVLHDAIEEPCLSKWFHKEPSTSEEPFCFTKGSLWWKKVLQIIKR